MRRIFVLLLAAVVTASTGCGSSSELTTGPSPAKCGVTLAPPGGAMSGQGGAGVVTVTTQSECAWTGASQASWITGLTPASGQGNAEVKFQVAGNPEPAARQGEIVVNDQRVQIRQEGTPCQFAVSPRTLEFGASEATATVSVTTAATCTWTATAAAGWLTVTGASSGTGSGTVTYRAQANSGGARSAALTIAGLTVTGTQEAGAASGPAPGPPGSCAFTLDRSSENIVQEGGVRTVDVAAGAGCAWTSVSDVPWITVVSGPNGVGSGATGFNVAANPGSARSGTVRIAGVVFTVNQAGSSACSASLASGGISVAAAGGPGSVGVTATAGCAWSAASTVSWITLSGPAGGTGNGTVPFTVAANTGAARTGTLSIAGHIFTVTQAGTGTVTCTASIAPASQALPAAAGAGAPIAVTIADGCAWTATTATPWIAITAGATGSGAGVVTFTVTANTGPPRTGTITIAGQTFTANQAAGCAASIAPTTQSLAATGGAGAPIAVTAAAGCAWTATSDVPWLSIASGASGSGNGTVTFTAAANTGAGRTGTLTIAGQVFTVTQASGCAATLAPTSQSVPAAGGAGAPIAVTAPAGCAWTATSDVPWLSIASGASGSGNGTVTFTAAANTGPGRTGTLTIAGQTFTVTQASGCAATLAPTSASIAAAGVVESPIAVTAPAGCGWTATSGAGWITIASGASGTGNGTVRFTVAANTGPGRTGALTIAGQTFAVTQASGCDATLDPTSRTFDRDAGDEHDHRDDRRGVRVDRDDIRCVDHHHRRSLRHRQRDGDLRDRSAARATTRPGRAPFSWPGRRSP